MEWSVLYPQERQPTFEDISVYIDNANWENLQDYLQETYSVSPKMTYSGCSGQPGWNVKYQKSGKSLCTLYPMPGYFIALVVMGEKELPEADLLAPLCSEYTRELYGRTVVCMRSKWLMMEVSDAQVLQDVKDLIQLRVKPKKR